MIELHTGLPGNGKTLYTIAWLKERAKREQRPVFYSGITLTQQGEQELGWQQIDAEKWMEAPPGALVVIDEAQRVFRPRGNGKEVPPHVAALETHRHGGVDLILITQHPMLIDNAVRRLAGKHRHVMRVFGTQSANIHEWDAVRVDCEKPGRREDSVKHAWRYDKIVYALYKSAELHTVKRSIPMRLYLLALVPLLLAAAGWYMYHFTQTFTQKGGSAVPKAEAAGVPAGASKGGVNAPGRNVQGGAFDPVADAKQYVDMVTPRVHGLPHTAPKYDEVTRPTTAPVPAACVYSIKSGICQCYTQQGTKMDVDRAMCVEIAHNGYFEDFDRDRNARREKSLAVLDRGGDSLPLSRADTRDRPMVAVLDADGYGVLGKRPGSASSNAAVK
jgi:zona occludens toxin